MKLYKKFYLNQWHVYAFEEDGSQDASITDDMYPITEEEADTIRKAPPSEEYQRHMNQQIEALGTVKRWPPRDYKELLGQVCVNSANFEMIVRIMIWTVAGIDSNIGMAFTGGRASTDELLEILKTLINQRAPDLKEELDRIRSEAKNSFVLRGAYVHGVWTIGENNVPQVGKFFSGRVLQEGRIVTLDDLEKLALKFSELEERLSMLILPRFVK